MFRDGLGLLIALVIACGPTAAGRDGLALAQASGLKIIVIAGEDAINVIQQKTAVAPIVEVRDRNDQPVAGAIVTFAIRGGRASFTGARTLTVTTNLAGRAVATGLTPTASGALQIGASVAYEGQTAAVTITQSNVVTAAQAAAVGTSAATAGGAVAGGLSITTIGIIAGAVTGGAVVATRVLGGGSAATAYAGSYTGQFISAVANPDGSSPCTINQSNAGTMSVQLDDKGGSVTGTASIVGTQQTSAGTCIAATGGAQIVSLVQENYTGIPVTGTAGALSVNYQVSRTGTTAGGDSLAVTDSYSFAGSKSGSDITGTLTFRGRVVGANGRIGTSVATMPVTLRAQ